MIQHARHSNRTIQFVFREPDTREYTLTGCANKFTSNNSTCKDTRHKNAYQSNWTLGKHFRANRKQYWYYSPKNQHSGKSDHNPTVNTGNNHSICTGNRIYTMF